MPGGGGWGDPLERDPELVLADVREQLLDPAAAEELYGVVVVDGAVDEAATARVRAGRA
jgi:N-methylhydantoinase B